MSKSIVPLIVIITIIANCSLNGQEINSRIDFSFDDIKDFIEIYEWNYIGEFQFESYPKPLEYTTVSFTLRSIKDDNQDWQIWPKYRVDKIDYRGRDVFIWPGPHKSGDIFQGTFEIRPLASGYSYFALSQGNYNESEEIKWKRSPFNEFRFCWCIDEDGYLKRLALDRKKEPCSRLTTFFFNKDSSVIRQYPLKSYHDLISYKISIYPSPRIGKTSTVIYRCRANYNIEPETTAFLSLKGVSLNEGPPGFRLPKQKGDEFTLSFDIVPRPINTSQIHAFAFVLNKFTIYCLMVFNEDGSLRYITNDRQSNFTPEMTPKFTNGKKDEEFLQIYDLKTGQKHGR